MNPHLGKINEIADGDLFFKNKMIAVLKNEFPKERELYFNLIQNKNYIETAEIVHKLKHKINLLGFVKGYKITKDYEDELRNNKPTLKTDFEAILNIINNFLTTI